MQKKTSIRQLGNINLYRQYLVPACLELAARAGEILQEPELIPYTELPTSEQISAVFHKKHPLGSSIETFYNTLQSPALPPRGELFLLEVMPRLLLFLAYSRRKEPGNSPAQYLPSLDAAFHNLYACAVSGETVSLKTYLCPCYNYGFGDNACFRRHGAGFIHMTGELLPTIGLRRFRLFNRATKFIFEPMLRQNIRVSLKYYAYTGSGGQEDDLWEIGNFVLTHYTQQGQVQKIFRNMRLVAEEAQKICSSESGEGYTAAYLGFEDAVIPETRRLYRDLLSSLFPENYTSEQVMRFISDMLDKKSTASKTLQAWCRSRLGMGADFATYFISEEIKYREQQNLDLEAGIFFSAFKECLIYYVLNTQLDGIAWGGETTSNYQLLMLEHLHHSGRLFPHFMLKPMNRVNPLDIFGIREPFIPLSVTRAQAKRLFRTPLPAEALHTFGLIRLRD